MERKDPTDHLSLFAPSRKELARRTAVRGGKGRAEYSMTPSRYAVVPAVKMAALTGA